MHWAKLDVPLNKYASSMKDWPNFADKNYMIRYTASIGVQENDVKQT